MNKNNTCNKCGSILNEQGICIYCRYQELITNKEENKIDSRKKDPINDEITEEDMLKTLERLGIVSNE